jgi:hypothetical protein
VQKVRLRRPPHLSMSQFHQSGPQQRNRPGREQHEQRDRPGVPDAPHRAPREGVAGQVEKEAQKEEEEGEEEAEALVGKRQRERYRERR